jgi:hypothetical protein
LSLRSSRAANSAEKRGSWAAVRALHLAIGESLSVTARLHRLLAVAAIAVGAAACHHVSFPVDAPSLRGITIPLPPPNWSDEPEQRFDIEGRLPTGYDAPGIAVYLYEKVTGRGYFTYAIDRDFLVEDVLVDLTDNCLETWFIDDESGDESTPTNYKVELVDDPMCAEDPTCSEPDEQGVCACLVEWTTGC